MAFMKTQVTSKQEWMKLDGNNGITFVPVSVAPELRDAKDGEGEYLLAVFEDYYDGREVYTVEVTQGYGVRLSAPGYMDCTPWEVFDTRAEAKERAKELPIWAN